MGVVTDPEIQRGLFNNKRNQVSVGEKRAVVGLDWVGLCCVLRYAILISSTRRKCFANCINTRTDCCSVRTPPKRRIKR